MSNKILIADDNQNICDALEDTIGEFKPNYEIFKTTNIIEAELLIRKMDFSLVFIDNEFDRTVNGKTYKQEKSGIDVVESLHEDLKTKTKIVMITAHEDLELLQRFISAGGFYYMKKPHGIVESIEKIIDMENFIPKPKNPQLYIIHAPSGTGKTETISYLQKHMTHINTIKKVSTGDYGIGRSDIELVDFIPNDFIMWKTAGESMGLDPKHIKESFDNNQDCIIGTGSSDLITQLVLMFKDRVKVFGTYFGSDNDLTWKNILDTRKKDPSFKDSRSFAELQYKRDEIMSNSNNINYDILIRNKDFFNVPMIIRESIIKQRHDYLQEDIYKKLSS